MLGNVHLNLLQSTNVVGNLIIAMPEKFLCRAVLSPGVEIFIGGLATNSHPKTVYRWHVNQQFSKKITAK